MIVVHNLVEKSCDNVKFMVSCTRDITNTAVDIISDDILFTAGRGSRNRQPHDSSSMRSGPDMDGDVSRVQTDRWADQGSLQ